MKASNGVRPATQKTDASRTVTKNDCGVGNCRIDPAPSITDGPRVRSRALGPEPQRAAFIDARYRPAAGADAQYVHRRPAHRQPADACLIALLDPLGAERNVCGRAAYVQRDDIGITGGASKRERAYHSACRSRQRGANRQSPRRLR